MEQPRTNRRGVWAGGVGCIAVAVVLAFLAAASSPAADAPADKPRIAFFPLAGNAKEELRNRAWLAFRLKLARGDVYEVLDGPRMTEIAAEAKAPITFATEPDAIKELNTLAEAKVLVWGEMVNTNQGTVLRVKILDLRDKDPKPKTVEKTVREATDLRFAAEEILQTLPGVGQFAHPDEVAVHDDKEAAELWARGKNLVKNGDFSDTGGWQAIFEAQKYAPPASDALPASDKVAIYHLPDAKGGKPNNVLAMNLSRYCAENNGMACLSDAIRIEENTRYRLQFRYKSDGPTLHVFVKGYTMEKNIKGETVEREVYRRQVPPTGATKGEWVTITDDLNPQHVAFPVQYLRVDLYAYLSPGSVMFDDVVLKSVGQQTRKAVDDGIKKPVTRPKGAN